jgi:two-component system, OmpR family, sensor histidine kinase MtrB
VSSEVSSETSFQERIEHEVEARMAVVAHELTSPIAVAQAYARLLRDELRDGPDGEPRDRPDGELLDLAERSASNLDHALHLLQRLRDTAASAEDLRLVRERFDLAALVRETVEDLSTTVADRHPVSVHHPEGAVPIVGDEPRVRQVLFNLTVNAAKYSDEGAPIEVTLSVQDRCATVEVRNHGFGVAPDDAEWLFQKGARGEGSGRSGLGVGLYVSRLIAEAHGGDLHVEPAEVRGSRFILRLPVE